MKSRNSLVSAHQRRCTARLTGRSGNSAMTGRATVRDDVYYTKATRHTVFWQNPTRLSLTPGRKARHFLPPRRWWKCTVCSSQRWTCFVSDVKASAEPCRFRMSQETGLWAPRAETTVASAAARGAGTCQPPARKAGSRGLPPPGWRGLAAARAGAALRGQGQRHGLLELLVAPVQLLHLGPVLRPRLAQLPQEVLVGADQGTGENTGQRRAGSAAVPQEPLPSPGRARPWAHSPPIRDPARPGRSPAQALAGPHTGPRGRSPPAPAPGMEGRTRPCTAGPPRAPASQGPLSRPPPQSRPAQHSPPRRDPKTELVPAPVGTEVPPGVLNSEGYGHAGRVLRAVNHL